MAELTPMMKQYFEIKNKCRDYIVFYRLGDFYEMFFEDALLASLCAAFHIMRMKPM